MLHSWGFNEKLPTGKGLVVLLSGEPGTGKTLAAEVIAAELGLNLYRINPAKVVSKFVGETEKNLNEILAQAKSTHAILFFDEADALFSSRVAKVETANDRFVNMETNFLLQQLERYEGIVILATNLETSIDQAFKRRIAYHIVVPFPKPVDRERIWRTLMPSRAPVGEIDYARLRQDLRAVGRAHQERDPARGLHRRRSATARSTTSCWPRPPRRSAPPPASCSSTCSEVPRAGSRARRSHREALSRREQPLDGLLLPLPRRASCCFSSSFSRSAAILLDRLFLRLAACRRAAARRWPSSSTACRLATSRPGGSPNACSAGMKSVDPS